MTSNNDHVINSNVVNIYIVYKLDPIGDDSYLFLNGRQELKFKAKTDQLVKEKLCIGNLSDQWTTSE